jgi:hypothetical protein
VRGRFPEYAEKTSFAGVVGVPGFWQDKTGAVHLWTEADEAGSMLLIPYRDLAGRIQACQFRRSAGLSGGQKRYSWLSTPVKRKGPAKRKGVTSGTPVHFTFREGECPAGGTVLITEGGLKARAFVKRRPKAKLLATSGVTCAHELLIAGSRSYARCVGGVKRSACWPADPVIGRGACATGTRRRNQ